ncbi:hypothetical protein B0H17DRAFT_1129633 [Mycena rosella]|uniref:Uncharacterized protein n=1 Tax=Mycena rosella TaxID=1033263 RepID=A0AAD7GPU9_MYCRO|nr:hypothetical protein B0H17DRAFT_1129633 [Mycena rosella]
MWAKRGGLQINGPLARSDSGRQSTPCLAKSTRRRDVKVMQGGREGKGLVQSMRGTFDGPLRRRSLAEMLLQIRPMHNDSQTSADALPPEEHIKHAFQTPTSIFFEYAFAVPCMQWIARWTPSPIPSTTCSQTGHAVFWDTCDHINLLPDSYANTTANYYMHSITGNITVQFIVAGQVLEQKQGARAFEN